MTISIGVAMLICSVVTGLVRILAPSTKNSTNAAIIAACLLLLLVLACEILLMVKTWNIPITLW